MNTFYNALANSLAAFLINNFVWFAITFWVYLETRSVIATAIMAGIYTATVAFSGFLLGSLVDRYPKKTVMLLSSIWSLVLYSVAFLIFVFTPREVFTDPSSVRLWIFIVLALVGAIIGNLRSIALSTLVTILVAEEVRDKANGLIGTANGISFLGASIFSGLVIGYLGVSWMLGIAIVLTVVVIAHLMTLTIPDFAKADTSESEVKESTGRIDIRGTIRAVQVVPGLFGLIFFHTFNNFLGGIFMALMDAYGLLLVSVQVWGALWGFLSLAFIFGGLVVARRGLGRNPLRTLFMANIAHVECMLCVRCAAVSSTAYGWYVRVVKPDSRGGSSGADYPAKSGYARAAGSRVRVRSKRRAGSVAYHSVFDWTNSPADLYSVHDNGRGRGSAGLVVWDWHRQRSRTFVHRGGNDRTDSHIICYAVQRLSSAVKTL